MTTTDPTRQPDLIRCNQCGNEVPRMQYCIRCGDPLSDEYNVEGRAAARDRFAAAPNEKVRTVALISTLFPQLPRAEMTMFRVAFLVGAGLILVLTLLGLFPVALVASAVLVPLLMVLYVWVVDIYEDEPLSVIGFTMLWGIAAGLLYALLVRALPTAGTGFGATDGASVALNGVVLPLLGALLMLAGPLFLLPQRRFNDVLDGATFGAASAVAFVGTNVIVQALPILGAGLRPAGDPLPWVIQLISLGVLQPVIAAGAIGATAAAFWLRHRAPITDQKALGYVGIPVVATVAAAVLLIAAGLAKAILPLIPATAVLALLAALALLWLRAALHLGLLQESREMSVERSIICPNCQHTTPEHTFCGNCGVSMRALPHGVRARTEAVATPTAPDADAAR